MATLDLIVAASNQDADQIAAGNVTIAFNPLVNCEASGIWNAWVFRKTTGGADYVIPAGAIVSTSYMTVNFTSTSLDEPDVVIYGLDTAYPNTFAAGGAGNNGISSRAKTSTGALWSNANAGGNDVNTSSLNGVIQELIDSYAPVSGIGLAWTSRAGDTARDTSVTAWDGSTTECARLHIEYYLNQVATVSDNVGITDSVTTSIGKLKTITDSIGITDSLSKSVGKVKTIADSVGITDSITKVRTLARTLSDSVGITDAVAKARTLARTISDSLGITDAVEAIKTVAGTAYEALIQDAVGIVDSLSKAREIARTLTSTVGITDAFSRAVGKVIALSDSVGITDVISNAKILIVIISDAVGISDLVTNARNLSRTISESVSISDLQTKARNIVRTIADSVGITDLISKGQNWLVTISDTVGITDVQNWVHTVYTSTVVTVTGQVVLNALMRTRVIIHKNLNIAVKVGSKLGEVVSIGKNSNMYVKLSGFIYKRVKKQ